MGDNGNRIDDHGGESIAQGETGDEWKIKREKGRKS